MAWRGLHLTRAARLWLADQQLVVSQEEGEVRIPLEDLAWVVIDTGQVTLTAALLSACMSAGVAVVLCDRTHTPNGIALPFHRHHRQAEVANIQLSIGAPLRKRLWQAVVQAKIRNQASALRCCGQDGQAVDAMAARVGSGDPDNVEARAAREYWRTLFPIFTRSDARDRRNGLLDYGYSVVRSCVARGLVAAGLLPSIGIGHASKTNAFNLADDIVEPFRPFVDIAVWKMSRQGQAGDCPVTTEERRMLASIPVANAVIGQETMTLLAATEVAGASLVRAMEHGSVAGLQMPELPRT